MEIKKMFVLILAVLMLCGLAACSEKPAVSSDDHSDWVWVRNGLTYGALSDTGYYYINQKSLSYFDFAANASTVLCAKVGCSHGTAECDACISGSNVIPMFFENDHLYYCPSRGSEVYSRNTTGAELKKVGDLAAKYAQEQKGVEIVSCVVAGGYLYYEGSVLGSVQENGAIITKNVMKCIGRLKLSTGKDEILIEETLDKNNKTLILCAARENGVLICRSEGVEMDRSDPNFIAAMRSVPVTLEHWNAQTGETTELFRKIREECLQINMVADGRVFFSVKFGENSGKYEYNYTNFYDLNTGEEGVAVPAYTRYLLSGSYAMCRDKDSGEYFIYNMNSGQQLPCTLEEASKLTLLNTSDKGFVARIIYETGTNEDGTSTGDWCYYYVSHESLADGLQEADLQYMYTF